MRNFYQKFLLVLIFSCTFSFVHSATVFINASGNFSNPGIWSAVLMDGDDVTINSGFAVVCDNNFWGLNNKKIHNLRIMSGSSLTILNAIGADLVMDGNLIVDNNSFLINNGKIEITQSGVQFQLNGTASYTHNPFLNVNDDETMFDSTMEVFSATSTLVIQKWFNTSVPLCDPSKIQTSPIGNLVLSVQTSGTPWEQNGRFSPHRILGSLTVTLGQVSMDDGTGLSTKLILQDVTINGTANVVFQSNGPNRNDTIICNNFTDVSTSASKTVLMTNAFGVLNWTVNGNVNITHDFTAIDDTLGTGKSASSIININVAAPGTGNFTIGGGNFDVNKGVNGGCTFNVAGNFTIQNNPGRVKFIDSYYGNLNFTANNVFIAGGNNNTFVGGNTIFPRATATVNFTVNIDFNISGASNTYIINSDTLTGRTKITIGRDLTTTALSAINLSIANTWAVLRMDVGRDFLIGGGNFIGQNSYSNNVEDSIIITRHFSYTGAVATNYFRGNYGSGNFVFNTGGDFTVLNTGLVADQGVAMIYQGNSPVSIGVGGNFTMTNARFNGIYTGSASYIAEGNFTLNVTGAMTMNSGDFKGIHNLFDTNAGIPALTANSFSYLGGNFILYNSCNNGSAIVNVAINNDATINYSNVSDAFYFIGVGKISNVNNGLYLNLNVGGNLSFGGAANGTFVSSLGNGNETIFVGGNLSFANGNNSFNIYQNSPLASNGHIVNFQVNGNMNVSGGNNFLSAEMGYVVDSVYGDVNITGGSIAIKGNESGGDVYVKGGYNQTAGTFYFYNNTVLPATGALVINMTINFGDDPNGDFLQSGGTINFDNNTSSNERRVLNVFSPHYTLNGTGIITRANAGTGSVLGEIWFRRIGTIFFQRANTHSLQAAKQFVVAGTTLSVVSGDIQMASTSAVIPALFFVNNGGIVTLPFNSKIEANPASTNSNFFLNNGGRLQLQHTSGFYNGTATAALSAQSNMTFTLGDSSIIEYNGNDTQWLTGIGVGTATGISQKYGVLEINFSGNEINQVMPYEFVRATAVGSINIRKRLILTRGALNLDDDLISTNGGGHRITVENTANTGITRVKGYIRSEISDGSGIVRWASNAITGNKVIPFGMDSSTANYIPFTINNPVGNMDTISAATYHTLLSDNLPLPPTVSHVYDLTGGNNSANIVDRFWYLNVPGAVASVNLTFVTTLSEASGFSNLKAQRFNTINQGWDQQNIAGQTNAVASTVVAPGMTGKTGWWALSKAANPLPVELIDFTASCTGKNVKLNWVTASETNNNYFMVQKSDDGKEFRDVKEVKGNGNSSTPQSYSIIDPERSGSKTYYRLKQVDFDGTEKIYPAITAESCSDKFNLNILAATSTESVIGLVITAATDGTYELQLVDIAGRLVTHKQVVLTKGYNVLNVEKTLANGIYVMQLAGNNEQAARKISIRR